MGKIKFLNDESEPNLVAIKKQLKNIKKNKLKVIKKRRERDKSNHKMKMLAR